MITTTEITSASAASLVDSRYLEAAADALTAHSKLLKSLISQKRMPDHSTPVAVIESLLQQFALMDSNNFPNHYGAGEREGRLASSLVARRHFNMSHGIGRSGDLTADQPKAAGSSLMSKLCNAMARDALHQVGLSAVEKAIVVPSCTGMTLALVLQYVRSTRKSPDAAKFVIWPRIDQKTCLKCIEAAGLTPVPVELRRQQQQQQQQVVKKMEKSQQEQEGEEKEEEKEHTASFFLRVHPDDVAAAIDRIGADKVACVLSTSSCFAPRLPDDPLQIARVCLAKQVPLVINNAYGVQSPYICKRLNAAMIECGSGVSKSNNHHHQHQNSKKNKNSTEATATTSASSSSSSSTPSQNPLEIAMVQSCDKNFLVPVGGSVLSSNSASFVDKVAALYAGRASADPTTDLFITLLELGKEGWQKVQKDRVELMPLFLQRMSDFAAARGESLVRHEHNDISFGVTLANFSSVMNNNHNNKNHENSNNSKSESSNETQKKAIITPLWLGGALYRSGISGPRILEPATQTKVTKIGKSCQFTNYGMHGLPDLQEASSNNNNSTTSPMIIMACAVGMTKRDVEGFVQKMEQLYPVHSASSATTMNKKKK